MKGLKRLNVIHELSVKKDTKWVHNDLFRLLRKEDVWITAYENVKVLTSEITSEKTNGKTLAKLKKLQCEVLEESYKFNPRNQILVPKTTGRWPTLGHPTVNDNVVKETIRMILEAVYEPIFDERSFGFRNGKGFHDALQYVEKEFRCVDWVIKCNSKNAYPTIDPNILCQILEEKISDPRLIRLIRKSLKDDAYINPKKFYSILGVPHSRIVEPILFNIYFNYLDQWVSQKEETISLTESKKHYRNYKKLDDKIKKLNQNLNKTGRDSKEQKVFLRKIKQLIQERNFIPSDSNPVILLRYVRYNHNWIIGIKGTKNFSIRLKKEIEEFIQSKLNQELNPQETKVINIQAGKVNFLGYDIFMPRNIKLTKYKKKDCHGIDRKLSNMLRFQVPVKRVIKCLQERGYISYENNKVRPISKASYSTLEDRIIVNHFKSVWLEFYNFYSGASNLSHLHYIQHLLHMSCAMTLAHRHRTSCTKVFKNYGKRLIITNQDSRNPNVIAYFPYRTKLSVSGRKWQSTKAFNDPFTIYPNLSL